MNIPLTFFRDEVSVSLYEGMTGRGPKYGPLFVTKGVVDLTPKLVEDKDGRKIQTEGKITFPGSVDSWEQSKITYRGREYTVVSSKGHVSPISNRVTVTEVSFK